MKLFNRKKESVSMKDQLIVFFNEIKYHYRILEESDQRTVFHLGVGLNIGNSDAFVLIYHAINLVEITVVSPNNIPENIGLTRNIDTKAIRNANILEAASSIFLNTEAVLPAIS